MSLVSHGAEHEERVGEEEQQGGGQDEDEVEGDLLEVGEVVDQGEAHPDHIGQS